MIFGQTEDEIRKKVNILSNASTLPSIFGYQYSSIVNSNGTKGPWKDYIKQNKHSLRYSDHEFYARYAVLNTPRFNAQIGACFGFSNFLLVDYYRNVVIDSLQYTLTNPANEQYIFKRLGLSYETNILLDKGVRTNQGVFLNGDISFKINSPGQRSKSDIGLQNETEQYYTNSTTVGQYPNQMPDGISWNKIMVGYQITRRIGPITDLQLKLSYGLLWGIKNPFSGSQVYSAGFTLDFGKRRPAKQWFESTETGYKFRIIRPKYE